MRVFKTTQIIQINKINSNKAVPLILQTFGSPVALREVRFLANRNASTEMYQDLKISESIKLSLNGKTLIH